MDGTMKQLAANVITENLIAQVDARGNQKMLLCELIDHRCDILLDNVNGEKKKKQQWNMVDVWLCVESGKMDV